MAATRKRLMNVCLAAAGLLLAAHIASSQIRVGGVTIGKPKSSTPAKSDTTQPSADNKSQKSDAGTGSSGKSEGSKTAAAGPKPPNLLDYFLHEIAEAKSDVDIYDPAERQYLVKAVQREWLLRAVSAKERAEHATADKYADWRQANPGNPLDKALDDLAVSVAKKLPIYKPGAGAFQFRNPVAEKMLMSNFKNTATMKVLRIGVSTAGWQIQKDSDGLPSYHFKFANVYFRDSSDDHPFCHMVTVRVKQDYAGGGTYSTETYQSSTEDELFGCP